MQLIKKHTYLVIKNYLSSEECENIIQRGNSLSIHKATTFSGDSGDYRNSRVGWFNRIDDYDIVNMIFEAGLLFCRNVQYFDITYVNDIQYTLYEGSKENAAKYDWHFDTYFSSAQIFDRKISFVLQLSNPDEYVGGDFEFQSPYEELIPEAKTKGTAIVFPSFIPHRVTGVTEGVRKSLVSWIEGPKFR